MPDNKINATISTESRILVATIRDLHFGRIENLVIRDGEPSFYPAPPRIVQDIKIGDNKELVDVRHRNRPELTCPDSVPEIHMAELLTHLRSLADESITTIDVRHGLPFRLLIEHG